MSNVIQGLWIGEKLSIIEQLSITSFLKNGHTYHLYVYDDVKNIPEGTIIMDANTIIHKNEIFTYSKNGWGKGGYGGFSNYFRYQLLFMKGNWWSDLDMICLKPLNVSNEIVIPTSFEGKWGEVANNNVLKFPKEHPFINECINYCTSVDLKNIKFGENGPFLIQRLVKENDFQKHLVPYYFFNPINWNAINLVAYQKRDLKSEIKEFIRPFFKPQSAKGRKIIKESYALHLWNEVWRQKGLSKEISFHKSSAIEKLKKRYHLI